MSAPASDPYLPQLTALRRQLERAVVAAADNSKGGRIDAAILLDAAAEAAIGLALATQDIIPARNAGLADLHNQLIQALRDDDPAYVPPTSWPQVIRLHRARNDAQHHQIAPAPDMLAGWIPAVERFVRGLVATVLGEDLSTVRDADAVEDLDLRAGLVAAEEAIADGRYREAILELAEVFAKALRAYDPQHSMALSGEPPAARGYDSLGIGTHVDATVAPIQQALVALPFATSLAELIWVRALIRTARREAPVIEAEARRAAVFVLAWVQRWEAFSHDYTGDRHPPRATDAPPPPSPSSLEDGAPMLLRDEATIDDVEIPAPWHGGDPSRQILMVIPYTVGTDFDSAKYHLNGWTLKLGNELRRYTEGPWLAAETSHEATVVVEPDPDNFDPLAIFAHVDKCIERIRVARRDEETEQEQVRSARRELVSRMEAAGRALMALTNSKGAMFSGFTVRADDQTPVLWVDLAPRFEGPALELAAKHRRELFSFEGGRLLPGGKLAILAGDQQNVVGAATEGLTAVLDAVTEFEAEEQGRRVLLAELRAQLVKTLGERGSIDGL